MSKIFSIYSSSQHMCPIAGDLHTDQPYAVDLHRLLREFPNDRDQISSDLDGIAKGHRWLRRRRWEVPTFYRELPNHGPKPLLRGSQICSLALCHVDVGRQGLSELSLQLREPFCRAVHPGLVPQAHKCVIKWTIELYQVDETSNGNGGIVLRPW